MKTIKNLTATVTYKVALENIEVPDEVYEELCEAYENGDEIEMGGMEYSEAGEWISSNIDESGCMDWEAEINFLKLK